MPPTPSATPRPPIRRKVLAGFGLICAMLAVIAIASVRSNQRYLLAAGSIGQARQVLEAEERMRRAIVALENLRLRYLVTGADDLRLEYEASKLDLLERVRELRTAAESNPPQLRLLDQLQEPLDQLFRQQRSEIAARREAGSVNVNDLFYPKETKELADRIERILLEFETAQNALVAARAAEADLIAKQNLAVILIGTALTFLALWWAGGNILRDFAARRRAEEALANEHNLFSSIIDTMPDHIFVKDVKGRYILDNAAHRRYLGVTDDRTIEGTTAADYFPAEAVAQSLADDREILETGLPIINREVPVTRAGATEKWLETTKVPLRDTDGGIVGLVGVSSDISERKEAEEKLKRSAADLQRSNEELQNFANVASHDLQEPLRKIQAFGDRLRSKCADRLGDLGLDYLSRMQLAAERMQGLIQDLLKLSRLVTQAQPFEPCDLDKIVRDVVSDLELLVEKKGAQFEVGPLPTVEGDPLQLWQLFQNLISNAMKFQRPGEKPFVRIDGRVVEGPDGRQAEITVRDNGIGFEERFAEQIFVVFQRLHSRDEYEGTGMGLAVCRKITDRHTGRIVAESAPGKGATFLVTLPVQQPSLKSHE